MSKDGWRPTGYPGVYERHELTCKRREDPKARRCTCEPSYRARLGRNLGWSDTTKDEKQAQRWKVDPASAGKKRPGEDGPPTFGVVAREWWKGVEAGTIPKRRGGATAWSDTTIPGYRNILFGVLLAEYGGFENMPGDQITAKHWQDFIDRLAAKGPAGKPVGRSRIDEVFAVVRSVYYYATHPGRAYWPTDTTENVQLPPKKPPRRKTVVSLDDAKALLAALPTGGLRTSYAMAIGTGLRRSELARSDWSELDWESKVLLVPASKSEAGRMRRPVVMKVCLAVLREEWKAQDEPKSGPIVTRSVFSGKHGAAATKAWVAMNAERVQRGEDRVPRITLHEGRHTYASTLIASGHTTVEVMAWMGHSSLSATEKYLQELPRKTDLTKAERLHAWEDGFDPPERVEDAEAA